MYKIFNTVEEVSAYTSQCILKTIQEKPNAVLGLATGSTMKPVYAHLVQKLQNNPVDVSQLTTFNLDEYLGLSGEHAQSYNYFMCEHLFNRLGSPIGRYNLPNGLAEDIEAACQAYSDIIKQVGGLDLQLLGIGSNGHIGFNEPYTSFSSRTHLIELTEQTRLDNSRFFTDKSQMPTHAITLGIQDILEAKEILLVATGSNKAEIMAELYASDVNEALPASVLKQHSKVTIVLDKEAAALLPANSV
ncbi:glucosamine-6-phosphate deaminase [Marinospirillum insulare]|uniref:Glucosamine-6-phosphate deaminase n=1 Tax=Marinospirillum insulare TaxID=217169 RepID=A0ABQ5ZW21_9GAMM|nr:glucosamine-6-phosphate deaminase [Marinospirillum insulare]GLR64375.1 glucosamine-6-phosphate deaminase 1 [Marinospirillum insulare]